MSGPLRVVRQRPSGVKPAGKRGVKAASKPRSRSSRSGRDLRRPEDEGEAGQPKMLLTVDEARARLGIGRPRIYRFINSGELRTFKLCGRRFVPVIELEAWINRQLDAADASQAQA